VSDKPRRFLSREDILKAPKADPNDPAQIAAREKEAEEAEYFNSLTSKCLEAGRQLADEGKADFSFAPPGVLYDVTDGKAGTPGRSEAAGVIFILSSIVRSEYKRRLAERYLEDTGLAPGVAALAHTMDSPNAERLMDWRRLTKEESAEYRKALGTLERLNLLWQQALGMALAEEPKPPGTAEEMEAAEAIIERSRFTAEDADGKEVTTLVVSGGAKSGHLEMPGAKEAAAIVEALQPKAMLPVEHYAQEQAKLLTDSAGKCQPTPREWLAAQEQESALEALGFGLERLAREDAERQLEEANRRAEEAEKKLAEATRVLPLRIGTRAVKAHTARKSDYVEALRALRKNRQITAADRRLLEREEPIALRGDELLVSAGLLEVARRDGALRPFGPARARMGGIVFDARLVVDEPSLEQFARLIGFQAGTNGRIAPADRRRIEEAITRLSGDVRPIVVESVEMRGKTRVSEFQIVQDVPVRRTTYADGRRVLELHGSLALGYWWGHILLSPQRWEEARKAIGARYTDDAMKWADVYFRRLVLAVANEHKRKKTPLEELAAGLPKRLKTAGLLEELELEGYRAKEGATKTAQRLEKIFDFCIAANSLQTWRPDGSAHYMMTLPHPVEVTPEDARTVQEEIFPALLGSGDAINKPAEVAV
jgi:hypothetical protein